MVVVIFNLIWKLLTLFRNIIAPYFAISEDILYIIFIIINITIWIFAINNYRKDKDSFDSNIQNIVRQVKNYFIIVAFLYVILFLQDVKSYYPIVVDISFTFALMIYVVIKSRSFTKSIKIMFDLILMQVGAVTLTALIVRLWTYPCPNVIQIGLYMAYILIMWAVSIM